MPSTPGRQPGDPGCQAARCPASIKRAPNARRAVLVQTCSSRRCSFARSQISRGSSVILLPPSSSTRSSRRRPTSGGSAPSRLPDNMSCCAVVLAQSSGGSAARPRRSPRRMSSPHSHACGARVAGGARVAAAHAAAAAGSGALLRVGRRRGTSGTGAYRMFKRLYSRCPSFQHAEPWWTRLHRM
jgi:hypothetical protein